VVSRSKAHCEECRFQGAANSYIIPGVVDEAVVLRGHEYRKRHGIRSEVHYHKAGDHCNERCLK
jgi:hypothetical protein